MSFSAEWLALREPVDHASTNRLVGHVVTGSGAPHLQRPHGAESASIVELGCGTGSNFFRLQDEDFGAVSRLHWTLVDYDPALLARAKERVLAYLRDPVDLGDRVTGEGRHLLRPMTVAFRQIDLAAGDLGPLFDGAHYVTSSALFDLVSPSRIDDMADAIVLAGAWFYTVLTYDGFTQWTPPHPADGVIREAFNAHQKTDKGFGAAAGPGGTSALSRAFYNRGYQVLRGTSPWVVDKRYGALRDQLDKGFAGAAVESGQVDAATADAWLSARLGRDDAVSIIGHEDLLALPR
jgi:SAM-dependent methyltransferase